MTNECPSFLVDSVKVGDTLDWTSQFRGEVIRHQGTVVMIIEPGERPPPKIHYEGKSRKKSSNYWGRPREGKSFIVWATDVNGELRMYWPYTKNIDWNSHCRKAMA